MKKLKNKVVLVLVLCLATIMSLFYVCACAEDGATANPPNDGITDTGNGNGDTGNGGTGDNGGTGNNGTGTNDQTTDKTMYIKVGSNGTPTQMQKSSGTNTYTVTITLAVGDSVTVYDSAGGTYTIYIGDFNGVATTEGEHVFTLNVTQNGGSIQVTEPTVNTQYPTTEPMNSVIDVTYTNTEGWSEVYAYVWNNATGEYPTKWPGAKMKYKGLSGYGEPQYTISVDTSRYDRIIFNNGSDAKKTGDLVLSPAVSGYYGMDGTFTAIDSDDYGKVQYFTLSDATNLAYLPEKKKKISVYTPRNYSTSKKYGVIYMFDSQNLYVGATGAEKSDDNFGSWAVDVAVNNLVKNGGDGVIIVAIDNTDGMRDEELTMSQSTFGTVVEDLVMGFDGLRHGQLDNLGNFMRKTLMPWVSEHYSVDTRREKTGICGSSSGGLAAYYLGLRDNDVYGYIGALSPANGLFKQNDWKKFYASKNFGTSNKPRVYAYCGKADMLEQMLRPATEEIKTLKSYGFAASDIIESYNDAGSHNESYWRIAFMEFLGKMAAYKSV